jgi:polyisoprenoid-binding protein YceI
MKPEMKTRVERIQAHCRTKTLGRAPALLGILLLGLTTSLFVSVQDAQSASETSPGLLRFAGKNGFATAGGTFHSWRFTRFDVDFARPEEGEVEVEVDIESLDTGSRRRDKHLRSEDFFEIEKFPTASIRVHDAKSDGKDERGNPRYTASFDIRIREVEKTIEGHFVILAGDKPLIKGGLTLNRVDFTVGKPRSGWNPMSIREEIPIQFSFKLPDEG